MIKLENVSRVFYRGRRELKALDNINIELPSKGMTFIVGENGAGKSTLAGIIAGIDNPTSGDIYYNDINYKQLDMSLFRSNVVSFVFQEVNLLEDFNVYDNLIIALKLSGKEVSNERVNEVLKKLNIDNLGKRYKHELSIGQMQRVAIARAILKDSQVLICDEGTSALDDENSIQVYNILKELSNDRLVIVITHDMYKISEYSENVILLNMGRVINGVNIKDTSNSIIYRKPKSIYKYGYKLFLKRKKALIISSILASISLFFLSIIFNLLIFKPNNYILKNIERLDLKYVRIGDYRGIDESLLIHTNSFNSIENSGINTYAIKSNPLYSHITGGLVNLSNDQYKRLGFKMMYGIMPTNDMDDYVAISDYVYYHYHDLGFNDNDGNIISINSMEEVINKKIKFNDKEYTISGIVDTGFDWDRYVKLLHRDSSSIKNFEMICLKDTTLITYYFVNEKNIEGLLPMQTFVFTENKEVLKKALTVELRNDWNLDSVIFAYLYDVIKIDKVVRPYLKYALILVFFINTLILFLLVNENISVRNNDIALIKSMGANNKEIFKMFYFETILLSIFLSVISYIVTITLNYTVNYIYLEKEDPLIRIFDLTYLEIFIYLAFLILVSFVSTLLGVYKNRNKYIPISLLKK